MANSVVEVETKEAEFKDKAESIKKALTSALSYLQIEDSILEVNLITSDEIRELNRIYAGKDKPTNVLSFEEPEEIPSKYEDLNYLGEVYISPEEVEKRGEDIIYLALHGVLHLLGFNHKKDKEAEEMERVEKEIMEIISRD